MYYGGLIQFTIPYMIGWHALESRKIAEEDLLETENH